MFNTAVYKCQNCIKKLMCQETFHGLGLITESLFDVKTNRAIYSKRAIIFTSSLKSECHTEWHLNTPKQIQLNVRGESPINECLLSQQVRKLVFQPRDLRPLPSVTYRQAWGQCVCAFVCKSAWAAVCVRLSRPLMSALITVESLGLSLAPRGSNTSSSDSRAGRCS